MPNAAPASDEALLARAQAGDRGAFGRLVERYQHQVAATITGMLGPTEEVDDVAQETFVRFYESLGQFRGEARLGTYLTRIAINLSLNALKRRKRQAARFRALDDAPAEPEAGGPAPGEALDDDRVVRAAVDRLDPKHRAVVVLRLVEGYSTRETADLLGVPQGTVLSRLSRALERLRAVLAPFLEPPFSSEPASHHEET